MPKNFASGSVYSVFCVGTGHTADEINNTLSVLYDDCKSAAVIHDGITEHHVNFAGHSRGAILCHMLADKIAEDPRTKHMQVTMALIDPVHQSKEFHPGAEDFYSYAYHHVNLVQYMAIIMENENTRDPLGVGPLRYPVKFVGADPEDLSKIYYIKMPGTHGSTTQALTNPVGKVCVQLIRNFMEKKGTRFKSEKKKAEDMCELFARIHKQTPLVGALRMIWDDPGDASEHNPENAKLQGFGGREAALAQAMKHNLDWVSNSKLHLRAVDPNQRYFFNDKHALFFKRAFPTMWDLICERTVQKALLKIEVGKMKSYQALWATRRGIYAEMGLSREVQKELESG